MKKIFMVIPLFCLYDFSYGHVLIRRSPIRIFSPVFHHGLAPNMKMMEKWGPLDVPMCTNALGLRVSCKNDINSSDIFLLGDSFGEGVGVPYEASVAGLMGWTNLSVGSYSPKLEALKLRWALAQGLKPKTLVLFVDTSDQQDEIIYQKFVPQETVSMVTKAKLFLFRRSFTYHHYTEGPANDTWMDIRDRGNWGIRDWGRKGLYRAQGHVLEIKQLCQANGINLIMVIYPWATQVRWKAPPQELEWVKFATRHGIRLINIFPAFRANKDAEGLFIPNDIHWNEQGNAFVAKQLQREGVQ